MASVPETELERPKHGVSAHRLAEVSKVPQEKRCRDCRSDLLAEGVTFASVNEVKTVARLRNLELQKVGLQQDAGIVEDLRRSSFRAGSPGVWLEQSGSVQRQCRFSPTMWSSPVPQNVERDRPRRDHP